MSTLLDPDYFFKKTSTFLSRRGSTLKTIDNALAEYKKRITDVNESVANLYLIIKCCDRYVKKSATKAAYAGMSASSSNDLQTKRLDKVKSLRQLALNTMVRIAPSIGKGLVSFEARKARGPLGTRALDAHYRLERTDYQANKLDANLAWSKNGIKPSASNLTPYSGTSVQFRANQLKGLGGAQLRKLSEAEHELAMKIRGLEDLPDDVAIYRLLGQSSGNWKVTYLNKIKRMQYLMVPGPDGRIYDGNEKLVDMPKEYMYAMDRYGGLYAAPAANNEGLEDLLRTENKKGEYFNHSSFNAGREVLCAGMILIKKGVLLYIDDNSGHYRPSEADLIEALRSLQTDGVSMVEVGISIYKSRKRDTPMVLIQAEPFMRDPTNPVEWSGSSRIAAGF